MCLQLFVSRGKNFQALWQIYKLCNCGRRDEKYSHKRPYLQKDCQIAYVGSIGSEDTTPFNVVI